MHALLMLMMIYSDECRLSTGRHFQCGVFRVPPNNPLAMAFHIDDCKDVGVGRHLFHNQEIMVVDSPTN